MQHLKFVVRWTDAEGKSHRKEYDTEPAARKARQWLIDNGAPTADVAVSINGKEHQESSVFPGATQPGIEQQSFIK